LRIFNENIIFAFTIIYDNARHPEELAAIYVYIKMNTLIHGTLSVIYLGVHSAQPLYTIIMC